MNCGEYTTLLILAQTCYMPLERAPGEAADVLREETHVLVVDFDFVVERAQQAPAEENKIDEGERIVKWWRTALDLTSNLPLLLTVSSTSQGRNHSLAHFSGCAPVFKLGAAHSKRRLARCAIAATTLLDICRRHSQTRSRRLSATDPLANVQL